MTARSGVLFVSSLNVSFNKYQFYKEECATCPQGFAAWVCAEDFNLAWWRKNMYSSAPELGDALHVGVYIVFVVFIVSGGSNILP